MDTRDFISFIVLVILILLSAFFSSAETALTTVSKIRMRTLADEGNARARAVLSITSDPRKMLSAILIGNNIVNLSASALATSLTISLFGSKRIGIATGILTFLVLVFGEVSPKTIASYRAEALSLAYVRIIRFLMVVLTPVIFLVEKCSLLILAPFHFDREERPNMTEEEFRTVLDVSHEEGVIEKDEHEIFHNVIAFGDTRAKDVMVPRIHIVSCSLSSTYDELVDQFREYRYTRLPVYDKNPDEFIGIINIKDLLLHDHEGFSVQDILQEPYFTYENKGTSELLMEMRRDTPVMAIVLDEYGEVSGLLTLEDLLEEIVGKIHDEDDEEEDLEIRRIAEGEYLAEGSMNLDDFCEELDLSLSSEDYDSIAGYMIEHLDRLPEVGDEITAPGVRLVVETMDEKRIETIHVYLRKEQMADEDVRADQDQDDPAGDL